MASWRRRLAMFTVGVVVVLTACSSSGVSTAPSPGAATTGSSAPGSSVGSTPSQTATPPVVTVAGCATAPVAAGRSVITFTSGGRERSYVRYVPATLAAGRSAPLVVDVTAYSPATLEESFSGFTKPDGEGKIKADDVGAVVITPEPVNGGGTLLTWNYVGTDGWTDDQRFFADLLDHAEATTCIDPQRVLLMGFAVGGVMGSIVACEQADRIAVLVTISGLYSPDGCNPAKPLPVLSFHGTGDRFVPFDGGVGAGAANLNLDPETIRGLVFMTTRPGARPSSAAWAKHDGCTGEPAEKSAGVGVTHVAWTRCQAGATVELYVIDGGEHTWPGSNGMAAVAGLLGPTSQAIKANDIIWTFFEAHTSRP